MRRPDFAREQEQTVRARARALSETIEWWYRDRYRLTSSDPRFLDATYDEMFLDAWASYYHAIRARGGEVIEDDSFNLDQILADLEHQEGGDAWSEVTDWDHERALDDHTDQQDRINDAPWD
jgi:hypothetical protein